MEVSMERSVHEIIQGILERNPELGLQPLGEASLQYINSDSRAGVPQLDSCELVCRPKQVKTVNHGEGLELELELTVTGTPRVLTIGPIKPSGEASLLTAFGLGWEELQFEDEQSDKKRAGGRQVHRLKGQVPLSFLAEGELARFQIQLTSFVGNMGIFFATIPLQVGDKVQPKGGGMTKGPGAGDDPRDLPPPTIHGEEIDRDQTKALIYLVSDFHLGSYLHGNRRSNDMDAQTLERFIQFLQAAERDAADFPHFDVVMNGDFLDLWQAKRGSNDTYGNRLQDIITSNAHFFSRLGNFLRRTPKCRFYYVIGNHDDPLLSHTNPDDPVFGPNDSYGRLRSALRNTIRSIYESHLLEGIGRVWHFRPSSLPLSFAINESYTNQQLKTFAIHGHQFDEVNSRDSDGEPSDGQDVAEQINEMQENFGSLRNIEYVPMNETGKLFKCLLESGTMSTEMKDAVEELKDTLVSASAGFLGDIADVFMPDSAVIDKIIKETAPDKVREETREDAEEILDDDDRRPRVKILVTGHTHLEDLDPASGETSKAYANTGSWFRRISARQGTSGCTLQVFPSDLPYVRISKEKDENKALVEMNYFSGRIVGKIVKVNLNG